LGRGFFQVGGVGDAGILLYGIEDGVNGPVIVDSECEDLVTLVVEGCWIDVSVCREEGGHDVNDGACEDAGFVVSDGLEVVWIDGLFDLLHEGAFEEVAFFEGLGGRVVEVFFNCDLILGRVVRDGEGSRVVWACESGVRCGLRVVGWANYEAEVAVEAASECGGDRAGVGLDLFVNFLERLVRRFSVYLRQGRVLEVR
jgi:hypothetical protein